MTWRVEIRPQPGLALANIIALQDAWRMLTPKSRAALLTLSKRTGTPVHPASLAALRNHGLVDSGAITPAGEAVVRHRPDQGDLKCDPAERKA